MAAAKCVAYLVNFLFLTLGTAIGAAGGFLYVRTEDALAQVELLEFLPITLTSYVAIGLGATIACLACTAIMGISCEKKGMVACYLLTLTLLIALCMAGVVYMFVYSAGIEAEVDRNLKGPWADATDAQREQVQEQLSCCGYNTTTDNPVLPCTFTDSCRTAIVGEVEGLIIPVGVISACVVGLLLVSLVAVCCVRRKLGKETFEDRWNS